MLPAVADSGTRTAPLVNAVRRRISATATSAAVS
jgi:hypothetical protein